MDDKIQVYTHKDIAGMEFEDFAKFFEVPTPVGDEFIENLEWALMYLNMNKSGTPFTYDETRKDIFSISTFDGAQLLNAKKIGAQSENQDLFFFNPIYERFNLSMFKDWNVKILQFGETENSVDVQLQKIRILNDVDTLKLSRIPGFKVAEHSMAFLAKNEKWYTSRQGFQLIPSSKARTQDDLPIHAFCPYPVSLDSKSFVRKEDAIKWIQGDGFFDILTSVNMMLGARLTNYYEWFVYIRETPQSIGIKIPVVPEASKEVFALRDIPEGSQRRKAICHFVRQHYRTIKMDYDPGEREVLVRKHLRGENKFNWRGLEVHVIPSEYDLNKIKTRKKFITV